MREVRPDLNVGPLGTISGKDNEKYAVQSLNRGFEVLWCVARNADPMPLADLAAATGISKPTVFRLAWNLERQGLLRRQRDGYAIGHRVVELLNAYASQFPLPVLAQPHLERLRDETRETAGLFVRDGNSRVCVLHFDSRMSVRRSLHLGVIGPICRGASGRVLLANLPEAERNQVLVGVGTIRRASGKLVSGTELARELAEIRKSGFAVSYRDSTREVWSVAAPIRDRTGSVVAAAVCSGPADRYGVRHVEACRAATVHAAALLSGDLGWLEGRSASGAE